MYNTKDIQFAGKHDFDKTSAEGFASWNGKSFSIGIFQWELKSSKKELKRGPVKVRVHSTPELKSKAFDMSETVVRLLDNDEWDGRKNVFIK